MDSDNDDLFDMNSEEFDGGDSVGDTCSDDLAQLDQEEPIANGTGVATSSAQSCNEPDATQYEILTTDQIVDYMNQTICEVNTLVNLPRTTIRLLLNHFNWDKEKLYDCYYADEQDLDKLFRDAHIIGPCTPCKSTSESNGSNQAAKADAEECCEICFCDYPSSEMTGLACNHRFCKTCWTGYLTSKIMDEGEATQITCAAHKCDIFVDDELVLNLITEPKARQKYSKLITNSFVENNKLLRWCSQPDCGHALKSKYCEMKPVKCICSHVFCFLCGEDWHDPVKCKLLKLWLLKCSEDAETSNWIASFTKECPKCMSTIEKDGGCNHMACKRCKAQFCWICLGPWDAHGGGYYNCNRFNEEDSKTARNPQEVARQELRRYVHYWNRYVNHSQSLKFENKLYEVVREKMDEMCLQPNISWIDVQYLKEAVNILCQCRLTLMYSYVLAYFLAKNNQVHIFEDNQQDLESATETLSEYLERDFDSDTIEEMEAKVKNKAGYCQKRRVALLEHVYENYNSDGWTYNVKF